MAAESLGIMEILVNNARGQKVSKGNKGGRKFRLQWQQKGIHGEITDLLAVIYKAYKYEHKLKLQSYSGTGGIGVQ